MPLLERRLAERLQQSPDQLRAQVLAALGRRLRLAARVPGHHIPRGGDPLATLAGLPLMDRDDLAEPSRWADPWMPRGLLRSATSSGSSGRPLTVLRDPSSVLHEEAFLRRHLRAFGWTPGWPALTVRADGPRDPAGPVFEPDPNTPHTTRVAASRLDDRASRAIVELGAQRGLRLLRGYPSALLELADRIDALGLRDRVRRWPLGLVHVSSESLSPAAEARLRDVFGAPVADHYGQAERALAIQSCPAGSRHLITDYGWGEVVAGRWVGTPLFGRGAVLLRYGTDDQAGLLDGGGVVADPGCDCGWPFPVVGRVLGRADDLVRTTDGRRIGRIGPAIGQSQGLEQVQIEQNEIGRLIVRVVVRSPHGAEAVQALERSLCALLADPGTTLELRVGERPVPGASGKVRAVLSTLPRDPDQLV